MPALISEQFRIHNAKQFEEAFSEASPTNMYFFIGRPQPWDTTPVAGVTSYIGQSSGSQHSVSYLADPDENNPPTPIDSFNYESEIFDDMISLKKVQSTNVRLVIPRNDWTSGVTYSMYRPNYSADYKANSAAENASHLYSAKFFVVHNYKVYKCIHNGSSPANVNGVPSTVAPTGTGTGIIGPLADGYMWKFMYSIGTDDVLKFYTNTYVPTPAAWGTGTAGDPTNGVDVKAAAVSGSINNIVIKNGGSGYTDNTYTNVPIRGDYDVNNGTEALCTIVVSGGTITSVTITNAGSGYTFGKINLNAVEIPGIGSGGSSGSLEVIISPPGGHGFDVYKELGAKRVMINVRLEYSESDEFPVDTEFRRIGILKDPLTNAGLAATGTTYSALTSIKFPAAMTQSFLVDEIVTQATTNAVGKVVSWDSGTKILKIYQSEYEHSSTGDQGGYLSRFDGGYTVTGSDSGTVYGPDVAYNATVQNLEFTAGYSRPEITKYTGDIIYTENRRTVSRALDQIEDVKLVVEF
jgi:hypothetical protein